MSRHISNIAAVFLKDLRQLWPLAALSFAVILAQTLFVHSNWLHNAAFLILSLFLISLVQQDAPASLRHEWLTRPVGSLDLLLAKILLAAIAIMLPAIAGPAVSTARHGSSVLDALLVAIAGMKFNLIGAFVLFLVAALTSTVAQAAAILAGLVLFKMLAVPLPTRIDVPVAGSGWTLWSAIVIITLIGGAAALWLQYAQRRTNAARCAFGGMIGILSIAIALLVNTIGVAHSEARPDAIPAIDGTLAAFRMHPLVGLGDAHDTAQEQDVYAALVRDPRFSHEVGNVVVEFGSAAHQDIMDRYTNGQDVPCTELRKIPWTRLSGPSAAVPCGQIRKLAANTW